MQQYSGITRSDRVHIFQVFLLSIGIAEEVVLRHQWLVEHGIIPAYQLVSARKDDTPNTIRNHFTFCVTSICWYDTGIKFVTTYKCTCTYKLIRPCKYIPELYVMQTLNHAKYSSISSENRNSKKRRLETRNYWNLTTNDLLNMALFQLKSKTSTCVFKERRNTKHKQELTLNCQTVSIVCVTSICWYATGIKFATICTCNYINTTMQQYSGIIWNEDVKTRANVQVFLLKIGISNGNTKLLEYFTTNDLLDMQLFQLKSKTLKIPNTIRITSSKTLRLLVLILFVDMTLRNDVESRG